MEVKFIVSYWSFDFSIKEICSLYIPRLEPNPSSNLCLFPEVRKLTSIGKNSPLLELDALIKESPSFSFNDKHGVTKEPFIYPYISFGYSF